MPTLRQAVATWLAPALPWLGARLEGSGLPQDPLCASPLGWEAARALAAVERCCMLYGNGLLLPRAIVDRPAGGGQVAVSATDAARALADLAADDLLIAGYAAALIGFGALRITRNARGGPVSMSFVAPWRCSIERAAGGTAFYVRIAADDALGDAEAVLPLSDMILIRWRPSPHNPLLAESPVQAIAPALASALQIRDTQAALLRNAVAPVTWLESDEKLTVEQMRQLRNALVEQATGQSSHRSVMLSWGMKLRTGSLGDAIQLQLEETWRAYQAEIGRAWGVPNTLLNEHADSAYNSAVAASRGFLLHSLKPWLIRVEDEFSRKLLTGAERAAGRRVSFDTESLNIEPGVETANYLRTLVDAGILTPDEARNRIGYPDLGNNDGGRPVA
ncbi:phage portal protein [Niveibacterium sp. SC-1]|uniref:phage portal protein n=1 Tax=Niveibacterium sp. SC-1 TaxID=3135646 RepID=UPI00311FDA6D